MTTPAKLPATWIEHLTNALFHHNKTTAPFMAMTAHLDESGTHGEKAPKMVMTCLIAPNEQWASFERELGQLLSENGARVFHARRFRNGHGDFRGWEGPKRERFNGQLLKIFDDHLTCGFCSVLPTKDYKEAYLAGPFPPRVRKDSQYGLCFRVCLYYAIIFMRTSR